jgi:hypothetical protein
MLRCTASGLASTERTAARKVRLVLGISRRLTKAQTYVFLAVHENDGRRLVIIRSGFSDVKDALKPAEGKVRTSYPGYRLDINPIEGVEAG